MQTIKSNAEAARHYTTLTLRCDNLRTRIINGETNLIPDFQEANADRLYYANELGIKPE